MKIKKLTETLKSFISETQIEGIDPIQAIKDGLYDEDNIDEIVLDNLDEFSVDDLVAILNNYKWYSWQGVNKLFPSGFDPDNYDSVLNYPTKLAEAVAKCDSKEVITDIWNIFYRSHGDLDTWGDAAKVWQDAMLKDDKNLDVFINASDYDDGLYWYNEVMDELEDNLPEFAEKLKQKLAKYNKEFAKKANININEDIENEEEWNEYVNKVKTVWNNIKDLMSFMKENQFIDNEKYPMIDEFYDELANLNNWLDTNFSDSEE